MAKNWYPVIDILTCMECGTCVNFCPHGVYDKQKAPVPVVVNPDGCIDHCHAAKRNALREPLLMLGTPGTNPMLLLPAAAMRSLGLPKVIRCSLSICIST